MAGGKGQNGQILFHMQPFAPVTPKGSTRLLFDTRKNMFQSNPSEDWMLGFQRPPAVPKKLPLHKFYMQQEGYSTLVDTRFKEKWDATGLEQHFALDFWCKCAQELLTEEDEEARSELERECDVEHEEALEQYNGRIEAVSNPSMPDARQREA